MREKCEGTRVGERVNHRAANEATVKTDLHEQGHGEERNKQRGSGGRSMAYGKERAVQWPQ